MSSRQKIKVILGAEFKKNAAIMRRQMPWRKASRPQNNRRNTEKGVKKTALARDNYHPGWHMVIKKISIALARA